jgi:hypothetical protein
MILDYLMIFVNINLGSQPTKQIFSKSIFCRVNNIDHFWSQSQNTFFWVGGGGVNLLTFCKLDHFLAINQKLLVIIKWSSLHRSVGKLMPK